MGTNRYRSEICVFDLIINLVVKVCSNYPIFFHSEQISYINDIKYISTNSIITATSTYLIFKSIPSCPHPLRRHPSHWTHEWPHRHRPTALSAPLPVSIAHISVDRRS